MTPTTTAQSLDALLETSKASESFKTAIRALEAGKPQDRIVGNAGAPPVKLLRVAMKLLETQPERAWDSLRIEGQSGCSNFSGKAVAQPGNRKIEFNWDCRWRAEQEGWCDAYGDPDQIRAARTYGYQCFERFEVGGL
jgi:hypothetical protein